MGITIGCVIFDEVEELDFVGPWEVFGMASILGAEVRSVTIAQRAGPVRCAKGLSVNPDHTFDDAPELDVLLVPGGEGIRHVLGNAPFLAWLREAASRCQWITSVCTGALVLHAAGLATGKRVTTHWRLVETLRKRGDVTVVEGVRYVRDGNLVTAAGVAAGIDLALWLTEQLFGPELTGEVRHRMEYEGESARG
jgi:transcriptional regulator GlxA family with amidase domain